jgi:pyruvate dehydrogenase E2 component (dihydrolipoamide acetyltransferase)
MALVEVKVPDIGDFEEVAVIEVLVKVGDTVKAEQSLITVESDKASMEIPSSAAGVVKEVKVKLGDKVKQGSLVLVLEAEGGAAAAPAASRCTGCCSRSGPSQPRRRARAAPAAAAGPVEVHVPDIGDFKDVAVIELLVKPGDTIKVEQALITVESDKASMEIPSSHAGVVKELKVKVGDKVNHRHLLACLDGVAGAAPAPAAAAPAPSAAPPAALHAASRSRLERLPTASAAGARAHRTHRHACRTPRPASASSPANWACRWPKSRAADPRAASPNRHPGLRQVGDGRRGADQGAEARMRPSGRRRWRRVPGLLPWPQGRLHQVRPDRAQGHVAHQEDQRRQPAPQLGRDPARHQPRRLRHHRARSLPRQLNKENEKAGIKVTMLAFMIKAVGRRAEEVPRVQQLARRRTAGDEEVLPHRLRGGHAERPGRAGDQGRRQEGRDPDQQEMGELAKKARDGKLARPT